MDQQKNKVESLGKLWGKAFRKDAKFNFPTGMPKLKDLLMTFSREFLNGRIKSSNNISLIIKERILQIQSTISRQLNDIFHHPQFQRLEATWRGLYFFAVKSYVYNETIKRRVLNISKKEMILNFERSIDFDRSELFKLVYEREYGAYGGTPYSFLVGDYEFSRSKRDMFLLKNISHVAAAAHSPFISAISPAFLDMNSFVDLGVPRNISRIFQSKDMIPWASFRKSEDSRYVSLLLPHILLRLPYGYGKGRVPSPSLNFEEDVSGHLPEKYLWGNAAYALAQRICRSFHDYGWTARFYGIDGMESGKVEHLTTAEFTTLPITKMSTDIYILSALEKELTLQGLACLCHCKMTDYAVFNSVRTAHLPQKYEKRRQSFSDNEILSVMLPHIMTSSRFAHYMKVITRDKIGLFKNKEELQNYLNEWLGQYVLHQTNIPAKIKARYPLKEASVIVFEDASKPGAFKMVVYLRPHYQLEFLNASVRFLSALPANISGMTPTAVG